MQADYATWDEKCCQAAFETADLKAEFAEATAEVTDLSAEIKQAAAGTAELGCKVDQAAAEAAELRNRLEQATAATEDQTLKADQATAKASDFRHSFLQARVETAKHQARAWHATSQIALCQDKVDWAIVEHNRVADQLNRKYEECAGLKKAFRNMTIKFQHAQQSADRRELRLRQAQMVWQTW